MNIMKHFFVVLITAVSMVIARDPLYVPLYWVDRDENIDTLFDRVIFIAYHESKELNDKPIDHWEHKTIGVIIKKELALTSFNPLRAAAANKSMENMITAALRSRYLHPKKYVHVAMRSWDYGAVKCGRQVIPMLPDELPTDMRHGPNSPVHDLMVLRFDPPVKFVTPVPPVLHSFPYHQYHWEKRGNLYYKGGFGPIRTILAKPDDLPVEEKLKFASREIWGGLYVGKFGNIVDCEEWFPREWGYFICLNNTENYPALLSGAVLFSDTTLFGVGAFLLKKDASSILVFTDVRPYWHLLYRTCSEDDQNLRDPKR